MGTGDGDSGTQLNGRKHHHRQGKVGQGSEKGWRNTTFKHKWKNKQAWQQHERILGLDQENKVNIHGAEASAEIRIIKEGIKRMRQSVNGTKELLLWKYKRLTNL